MTLTLSQIDRFYELMIPLLIYVNEETNTLAPPVMEKMAHFVDAEAENALRTVLWCNPSLLDDFLLINPFDFNHEDMEVVAGWRNFRFGNFTFCKVVRGAGIFLAHEDPQHFYSVYPLLDPFKVIFPEIPTLVRTALIPYQGVIVYDGSMMMYGISFPPGQRTVASQWVIDAEERGLIKTTIPELSLNRTEQVEQVKKTNKSVLRNFKTYLRKKRLSDKIINREIETAESLADFVIRYVDETASLRDITMESFNAHLSSCPGEIPRYTIIGMKRFFTYLKDTDRIDWELAQAVLAVLRSL